MISVQPTDEQVPRAGDVVAGKYRIETVIGAGGMGVVLGAQDISLGRRVAIKFLAPSKAKNSDDAARFIREARAAASIQSEHVVRVFEVGALANGAPYIVMEHLSGGDLGQILVSRGALPIEEAVDYLLEACEAKTCTSASSFSPNSGSSNCERANCRRACTILNDQSCLSLLDNAERNNPLPF